MSFVAILFLFNLLNIIFKTPMIADQHWAQKIFYVHVPSAWVGFLSYFVVMVSGFMLFIKNNDSWDDVGLAAAEIGTFFMGLVLITGPIWAKPIWGTFWIWEPRLTTTLILFLFYLGYFMLREFGGSTEQVPRYAAILGIIAFIDVPLIFYSVKFWLPELQSHPQVGQYFDENNSLPTYLILFSFFSFIVVSSLMIRLRVYFLRYNRKVS